MKKLFVAIAIATSVCSFSAHADLQALAGGGIAYSQDSTAGHLSTDDLQAIQQDKYDQNVRKAKFYCVRKVWKMAGDAFARTQLQEDTYPSDQWQADQILIKEKSRNAEILGCMNDYVHGKLDFQDQ